MGSEAGLVVVRNSLDLEGRNSLDLEEGRDCHRGILAVAGCLMEGRIRILAAANTDLDTWCSRLSTLS